MTVSPDALIVHDGLTGLYSRDHFLKVLNRQVQLSNEQGVPAALLLVELQRLRKINSTYGYPAGDAALRTVAEAVKEVQRAGDYAGRIGSDVFAVLLTRIANPGHAKLAALKVQRLLDIPCEFGGEKIRCQTVSGVALCPLHASQSEHLLRIAEDALDHAKSSGLGLGLLNAGDQFEIQEGWDIEYALAEALEKSQFSVFFQPKVSISQGALVPTGAEALLRWECPTRGVLTPDFFLPIAERAGLLNSLTVWMLNSALRLSRNWSDKWGELTVSVNMPPAFVAQSGFTDLVFSTLNLWQSKHIKLRLEILEDSIAQDELAVFDKLRELRQNGIGIAIDDFGTGYSSLAHFRDIPADELKIDKSFVRRLMDDDANANIVELIIALAHRFGLTVVAEGVEKPETLARLQEMGCDEGQGYIFSKPLPEGEFNSWLMRFGRNA